MTIDPRLLRTFAAVARRGSFSAAAKELGYTQSAISQQIVALESDLGADLLTRRPVAPTAAGARLLEHAGPILSRLDAARADVSLSAGQPGGRLEVAASPLAITAPLLRAASEIALGRTASELGLRCLSATDVAESVAAGDADIGVVSGIAMRSGPLRLPGIVSLQATLVREEDLIVAVRPEHPLADGDGLRLADLVDALWIDTPDLLGPIGELCVTMGVPSVRLSAQYHGLDVRSLLDLLATTQGLALLPRSALSERSGLVGVALSTPELVHRVETLHHRLASPWVREWVEQLNVAARSTSEPLT